jgi:hypothetical protein
MRRLVQRTAIIGFLWGAVVVGGGMLFSEVVLLILLALLVVLTAVARSVEQGLRLISAAPLRKGRPATARRASGALPR